MLKSIFKSRIFWLIIGVIIVCFVISFIPGGVGGVILLFLWKQKWGILIGIGGTILLRKRRKGRSSEPIKFKLNFRRKEKQPKASKAPKAPKQPKTSKENKNKGAEDICDEYDEWDYE